MYKPKKAKEFQVRGFGSQITVTWPGVVHAEAGFSRLDPKIKSATLIPRKLGEELARNRELLYRIKEVCGVSYIKLVHFVKDGSYMLSNIEPTYDLNDLLDTIFDLKAQVANLNTTVTEQDLTIATQNEMIKELASDSQITVKLVRDQQSQPNHFAPPTRISFD